MNRADRRKAGKKDKVATYNYTQEQLDAIIRSRVQAQVETIKKQASKDAIEVAFTLMLAIPLTVLSDRYWIMSAKKRLPKFLDEVLKVYNRWDRGLLSMEELRDNLWNYGGIKIEAPKGTEGM